MAARVGSYRLTARAEADIFEIFVEGLTRFGEGQAARYRDDLVACLHLLAANPLIGRMTEAVGPDIRRHPHQSHVIFYEVETNGVLILAIVHGHSIRQLNL